eukprot:TRINITY_DN3894_c0_g1_i1.p1 TRINITY_DN3894_c0_g1~~TRINITY_DN3894_c0_g1_i1.p1  ORF type:complete len:306 (-),score=41.96 TRINITY_DN3894_c0_g1_i1:214-1074(-)
MTTFVKELRDKYVVDFGLCVVLAIAVTVQHFLYEPHDTFFLERDPSLSYPLREESVSQTLLIVIMVIPFLITCAAVALMRFVWSGGKKHSQTLDVVRCLFVFLESVLLCLFMTDLLKSFAGRKRPNFFALCDYKGYRAAVESRNFTAYERETVPGAIGDISFCQAEKKDILDAQKSFPSGHSSLIFNCFAFMMIQIFTVYRRIINKFTLFALLIITITSIAPSFVALSRTRDYYHNYSDILAGAVLGVTCAIGVHVVHSPFRFQGEEGSEARSLVGDLEEGTVKIS